MGLKAPKVFGIGFHKTGTSTLAKALGILGYRVGGPNPELLETVKNPDQFGPAFEIAREYDALQDTPWFLFYKQLDMYFPGSKFVLTRRSTNSWLRSYQDHFGGPPIAMHKEIYGHFAALKNPAVFTQRFEKHNADVIKYFEGRDQLLVLDITQAKGWDELCSFLGCAVPLGIFDRSPLPFPRANARAEREFLTKFRWIEEMRRFTRGVIGRYLGNRSLDRVVAVKDFFRFRLR